MPDQPVERTRGFSVPQLTMRIGRSLLTLLLLGAVGSAAASEGICGSVARRFIVGLQSNGR